TTQRLDESAVGTQQGLGTGGRVTDDDGLTPTEVELRQRVLIGHSCRQRQHIVERLLLRTIGVKTGSTERRSQRSGVYRDDGPQPARRVLAENNLFVTAVAVEYTFGHGGGSFVRLLAACGHGTP